MGAEICAQVSFFLALVFKTGFLDTAPSQHSLVISPSLVRYLGPVIFPFVDDGSVCQLGNIFKV